MSTVAALLFAGVAALEAAGILRHYHLPVLGDVETYRMTEYLWVVTGTMALTLWLVAYMTSSIAERLRARDRELLESHQASLSKSRQLEALNERLRRIDAERTRFLTLVTHELRAPINTIYTNLELLLSGYLAPERVDGLLERLMQRTEELSDLVTDLLRLARARQETSSDVQSAAVQADDVLVNVVQLMKAEADSKDIFLSVGVAPDLAPVQAHPDRLKLVWTNLLSNAIKYTEPGGIIAVALKQDPHHVVGTIRDTGIGIAPEDQGRIFEEFYRAENARSLSSVGTGVGLAIVKRLVENWGGEIELESQVGLGSTFTIRLPRADVEGEGGS
jgi:two-component system phosphate regulon sensor histidine kinase PhoR